MTGVEGSSKDRTKRWGLQDWIKCRADDRAKRRKIRGPGIDDGIGDFVGKLRPHRLRVEDPLGSFRESGRIENRHSGPNGGHSESERDKKEKCADGRAQLTSGWLSRSCA
ncbi:unannotated protein [freshwater metagenome]|uniref:Unannotated protein n=1 Tax=freshwater metagenome TaxID=449393 RepID=A0A6J6CKU9_9ZZZZ